MTYVIPSLNVQTIIFQNIADTLNLVINALANVVITVNNGANGSVSTGNGWVNGIFGALTGSFGSLGGGNVQSSAILQIYTNTYVGNSTVNTNIGFGTWNIGPVQANSTGIFVGANVSLNLNSQMIGNTTANYYQNSAYFSLANSTSNAQITPAGFFVNGVLVGGISVVNNGGTVYTQSKLNLIANGTAFINVSTDTSDGWVNVIITATGGAATPAGPNTALQWNDSGIVNGTAGFTFTKTTNTAFISNTFFAGANVSINTTAFFAGNATANATLTQALLTISNATNTSTVSPTQFAVGISIVNTVAITIGANLTINSSALEIGNSTVNAIVNSIGMVMGTVAVNAVVNSTIIEFANSTQTANLSVAGLVVGVAIVNATIVAIGANVIANSSALNIGNTTVSAFANSLLIQVANSTQAANISAAGLAVGNTSLTGAVLTIGNSTVNVTANSSTISANAYVGNGVMSAPNSYWNNTAGVVMTTDKVVNAATPQTITDNATPAWNMSNGINFAWTLGASRILPNPTGTIFPGRSGVIQIKQDVTGGRTLSFGNCFVFSLNTAPSINTTASLSTFLSYYCVSSSNVLITMPAIGVPV